MRGGRRNATAVFMNYRLSLHKSFPRLRLIFLLVVGPNIGNAAGEFYENVRLPSCSRRLTVNNFPINHLSQWKPQYFVGKTLAILMLSSCFLADNFMLIPPPLLTPSPLETLIIFTRGLFIRITAGCVNINYRLHIYYKFLLCFLCSHSFLFPHFLFLPLSVTVYIF